jgi:hypothetical protein
MSSAWPDLSASFPAGFRLRDGVNPARMTLFGDQIGPNRLPGVNVLVVAAIIAGESASEQPDSVCTRTIGPCARLLSDLQDDVRPRLAPYAWAMVGTNTPPHAPARLQALGRMAIEAARLKETAFTKAASGDRRAKDAIAAACAYWDEPNATTAGAANAAQKAATAASNQVSQRNRPAGLAAAAAACAAYCAHAAYIALMADDDYFFTAAGKLAKDAAILEGVRARFAADAAEHAAMATITPHDVAGAFWRAEAAECALRGLRDAIEAGPHGAVPATVAARRLEAAAEALLGR